ncbi:MAG: M36 family metallopeptidase [Casimicrobiaceae bacterium]
MLAYLLVALGAAAAWSAAAARALPEYDAARAAAAAGMAAPAARDVDAKLRQIEGRGGVALSAQLPVPAFLWGDQAAMLRKSAGVRPPPGAEPPATARAHLRDLADAYRFTEADIETLPVHDVQRLSDGSAIVRFRNAAAGIEIFRESVNVLLDRSGGLVAIGGAAMGAAGTLSKSVPVAGPITPSTAAAAALVDYGVDPAVALHLRTEAVRDGYDLLTLPPGLADRDGTSLAELVRVRPVWYRLGTALVPAHYVELQVHDGAAPGSVDAYAYVVSGRDGAVLYRHSLTADAAFTYRAWAESTPPYLPLPDPSGRAFFPHPTGSPDGVQPPLAGGNLVTLQNAPFSRNDPWLPPGATRTIGNNVEAFANLQAPDDFGPSAVDECNPVLPVNGDLHACTSSGGAFDYGYDFGQPPNASRAQVMAAVTNLFYLINYLHDWYYDAGFTEAAGNAQADNYGRGGLAGDSLIAQAQDYTGVNNASMSTPADGQRPRMRVLVWDTGTSLVRVAAPATVSGVKPSATAAFGAQVFDFTAEVAAAKDAADSLGPSTTDGCSAYLDPAAVAGKIALVDRGVCTFVEKARNAQAAGAIGLLVANNVTGLVSMAGTDTSVTIPLASIALDDGAAVRDALGAGPVRVRMARAVGVNRDAALDTTLVAHEWGHYISNRLINDANGLTTSQAIGMGEGFADFHALLLLVKAADRDRPNNADFSATYSSTRYPLGGSDFAPDVYNNAYYYGIRRYPYTRDLAKNPLTFRHIAADAILPASPPPSPRSSAGDNAEVHNTGEVWASMLWECYSNLLNDTARLSFDQAQDRMKRYLVAAYKIMPSDPTFITGRDALLAVMQAQDPRDRELCLAGFAKRGAGIGAVAPSPLAQDNTGVVQSFRIKAAPANTLAAVEYYHAGFDHYFVTYLPDEIAKLDNGTFAGWVRTGESLDVYPDLAAAAGVCRFFSTAFAPKSSHFYTADPTECQNVRQNPNWQFEAVVFALPVPDAAGTCPVGTTPVYRLYNDGAGRAPNHRYTTRLAIREQMRARGWIPEGQGPLGVAMCSPL